jgi:hypothetical protein
MACEQASIRIANHEGALSWFRWAWEKNLRHNSWQMKAIDLHRAFINLQLDLQNYRIGTMLALKKKWIENCQRSHKDCEAKNVYLKNLSTTVTSIQMQSILLTSLCIDFMGLIVGKGKL